MTLKKLFTLLALLSWGICWSQTQTFTVTSAADAGVGTLRDALTQAITLANSGGTADVVLDASGYCQISMALPMIAVSDGVINIKKSATTSNLQGIQYLGTATDNSYFYGLYIKYVQPSGTPVLQQPSVNIDGIDFVDFQCHASTGLNTFPIYSEMVSNCFIQNCNFLNDQSLTSIYFGIKDVFQSALLGINSNTFQKSNYQYCIFVGAPFGSTVYPIAYHADPNLNQNQQYFDQISIESNILNNTGTNLYSFVYNHGAITVEKLLNNTLTRIKGNYIQSFDKGICVSDALLDIPNGIGYASGAGLLLQANRISNCNMGLSLYNPQPIYNIGGNQYDDNTIDIVLNSASNGANPLYAGYGGVSVILNSEVFVSHTNITNPSILVTGYVNPSILQMSIDGSIAVDGQDAKAFIYDNTILGGFIDKPIKLLNNSNNQISVPSIYAVQYNSQGSATAIFTLNGNYHTGARSVDFYLSNSNGDLTTFLGTKSVVGPVINARAILSNATINVGSRIAAVVRSADATSEAAYSNVVDNVCCQGVLFTVDTGAAVKSVDFEEGVKAVVCNSGNIFFTPDKALCVQSGLTFTWDFGDGTAPVTFSTPQKASHLFATQGAYYVTLTIGGNGCNANVFTAQIYVVDCCCSNMAVWQYYDQNNGQYNIYPALTSGVNIPVTVNEGQIIGLIAQSTCNYGLPVRNISIPVWNFGDGTATVSGINVTHVYQTAGSFSITYSINSAVCKDCCPPENPAITASHGLSSSIIDNPVYCNGEPVVFEMPSLCFATEVIAAPAYAYSWDFGDGTLSTQSNPFHIFAAAGTYTVSVTVALDGCPNQSVGSLIISIVDCAPPPPCEVCIGSFAPLPGEKYILSAWVKQAVSNLNITTYTAPNITLAFTGGGITGPYYAKGAIIDGWQRLEEEFIVPPSATDIEVQLNNSSSNNVVYFDDIRIHPFNSNLKSFVYDPVNLRLMAELDQNNYATFYEYDEEGKLVRVKKETERGIKTIKESINNTSKK